MEYDPSIPVPQDAMSRGSTLQQLRMILSLNLGSILSLNLELRGCTTTSKETSTSTVYRLFLAMLLVGYPLEGNLACVGVGDDPMGRANLYSLVTDVEEGLAANEYTNN